MEKAKERLPIDHINIRQSISILVGKIILADFFYLLLILLFFSPFFIPEAKILRDIAVANNIVYFLILAVLKIILVIYIILQWLNEYYEITTKSVTHKHGILFKKTERFPFNDIKLINIQQDVFGKLLNFGTISIYDWKTRKENHMYLIHNPIRYLHVLESLIPKLDEEKNIFIERGAGEIE
jgi:membrane protein YdbS with pleckstrin-like domain